MAEMGLRRMADAVAIAHDSLCITVATICRNGDGTFSAPEKTFGRWCDSMGLNRKAAERLLQVARKYLSPFLSSSQIATICPASEIRTPELAKIVASSQATFTVIANCENGELSQFAITRLRITGLPCPADIHPLCLQIQSTDKIKRPGGCQGVGLWYCEKA